MRKAIKIRAQEEFVDFNPEDVRVVEDARMSHTLFYLKYQNQGLPYLSLARYYEEIRRKDISINLRPIEITKEAEAILEPIDNILEKITPVLGSIIDLISADIEIKIGKKIECMHMLNIRNCDIGKALGVRPQQISNTLRMKKMTTTDQLLEMDADLAITTLMKMSYSELVASGTSQLGVEYTGQVKAVYFGLCKCAIQEQIPRKKNQIKTPMNQEQKPEETVNEEIINDEVVVSPTPAIEETKEEVPVKTETQTSLISTIMNDASLKTKSDKIKKLLEGGLTRVDIMRITELKASNPQIYTVIKKMKQVN